MRSRLPTSPLSPSAERAALDYVDSDAEQARDDTTFAELRGTSTTARSSRSRG
jgi:hypothetical protein